MPYISRQVLVPQQPASYPKKRVYQIQHGVLVMFKVGGELGFFSILGMLIMLTTALALVAAATTVTDLVAIYLHPKSRNYFHLKYDVSPDFDEMWICPACGFANQPHHKTCQ